MSNVQIGIIVGVAIVVILIIVGVSVMLRGRKKNANRQEAAALREDIHSDEGSLLHKEEAAAEAEREAKKARAEADEKAARAEKLEMEARGRSEDAQESRSDHDRRVREADRLDPDIKTDKQGNRLENEDESRDSDRAGVDTGDFGVQGDEPRAVSGATAYEETRETPAQEAPAQASQQPEQDAGSQEQYGLSLIHI